MHFSITQFGFNTILKIRIALKLIVVKIFELFPALISDYNHSRLLFLIMFGRLPNLKSPKTFNEHLCSLKIHDSRLLYTNFTDKYEARKYVESVIGKEYLNEIYGVFNSFDEINIDLLPDQFVLKCTHGSSFNIIVKKKSDFNVKKARSKMTGWLKINYYLKGREKNYKNIQPRIICERFLDSKQGYLEEFKMFCFHEKVQFIQQNTQIKGRRHSNMYDSSWKTLELEYGYRSSPVAKIPDNARELVEIAEELSLPFDFIRVDLYNFDGKIFFSELTFHPGGGLVHFRPNKYDYLFGQYFKL